jgi:hypothetical protein
MIGILSIIGKLSRVLYERGCRSSGREFKPKTTEGAFASACADSHVTGKHDDIDAGGGWLVRGPV